MIVPVERDGRDRRILLKSGRPDLAEVYLAHMRGDRKYLVEFVDACAVAGGDRREKWVIIISTQFGCPAGCLMCDAGGGYLGDLTADEMLWEIRTVVEAHPELDPRACRKFKVQFARMGEPSLNDAVLDVIRRLGKEYPNCIPCVATLAVAGREAWFKELLDLREGFRDLQLQFSMNTTDTALRDELMPIGKMSFDRIARYGEAFYRPGSRKPSLNFAVSDSLPLDPGVVARTFDPERFVIKLTPLNPTQSARDNELVSLDGPGGDASLLDRRTEQFRALGYEVVCSIGDWEENRIGSNCGQLAARSAREDIS